MNHSDSDRENKYPGSGGLNCACAVKKTIKV